MCYGAEEINENVSRLAGALGVETPDFSLQEKQAEEDLQKALQIIGSREIVIDYTATPRLLSLARRLLEAGFNVTQIFADSFIPGDRKDFEVLQKDFPDLKITPTLDLRMRYANPAPEKGHCLAIGQKAAFFTNSENFVDLVWGRGFYGHRGVSAIAGLLVEAFRKPKDIKSVISHKGWGCESCI